jgi:hypothetical protein
MDILGLFHSVKNPFHNQRFENVFSVFFVYSKITHYLCPLNMIFIYEENDTYYQLRF